MERTNPELKNGYTRLPNELLKALCRARLGSRELKVVLAVVRLTLGYAKKEARISLALLERLTSIRKDALLKTIKSLEAKKILVRRKDKNRLILGIQDHEKWSFCGDTERQLPFCGDIKRQRKGTQKDNLGGHKKTTPDTPQTLEPQGIPGSLKKTFKENFKEISSKRSSTEKVKKAIYEKPPERRDPEGEIKEIISLWEKTFQAVFPVPPTKEEVRAADYMLYLRNQGRLPALRNPAAYLKTLAQTDLEPFPSLFERKRQVEEAEAWIKRLAEREAEIALPQMKADAEAEAKARRKLEEMSAPAKMELLKTIKLKWPQQPPNFWERQAITQIKKQILREIGSGGRA